MGRPGQDNTSVTPEAEPQAMTLEEALVLADKKGVDVHFLNAPLRVVGERVAIHDGTEDGYPIYGGTWPEAFSKWLDRPVVERDDTAELVEALEDLLECFDPEAVARDKRTPEAMRDFAVWQARAALAKWKERNP